MWSASLGFSEPWLAEVAYQQMTCPNTATPSARRGICRASTWPRSSSGSRGVSRERSRSPRFYELIDALREDLRGAPYELLAVAGLGVIAAGLHLMSENGQILTASMTNNATRSDQRDAVVSNDVANDKK